MSKNGSLVYQVKKELQSKVAFGESRFHDKRLDKINNTQTTKNKIYSFNTLKTYIKQCSYFVKFVKQRHPKCKTLSDCRPYADEFLQYNIDRNLSAYTIKTQVAALSKLYSESADRFIKTPKRSQRNIKRSRFDALRDKHFNPQNHPELIAVSESTGLRRNELSKILGTDLFYKNGLYYLNVNKGTKGGKPRIVELYHPNSDVLNLAIKTIKNSNNQKVFQTICSSYDVHNARSVYARNLYNKYKSEIHVLSRKEKYYSKTFQTYFDRNSMKIVSKNLGHNRESVVIYYFRKNF